MPERRPLVFGRDEDRYAFTEDGMPFAEAATEMEIGPCIKCGKTPDDTGTGGSLDNIKIVNGVVRGDNTCYACLLIDGDEEIVEALDYWNAQQDNDG
jgi:hypothetical protein